MNPAVLNYLQSQQTQQPGNNQGTQPFNPFDSGIKAAIESARMSLDMTEKQQDKALRRSMLAFGDAYRNEAPQKGFLANFGSAARSLAPAILAHDEVEDQSFRENNNLANQILSYNAAEQQRQANEEEKQYRRAFERERFDEQKRQHALTEQYRQEKLRQNELMPAFGNGEYVPIMNKTELTPYLKSKTAIGTVLKATDHLEKEYKKLREKYKNNIYDPMGRASRGTNFVKGLTGRLLDNKGLIEETNDIAAFNSLLNEYVLSSERDLKGGGSTGPEILKYFEAKNIYPNFATDNPQLFQSKLKAIKEKLEDGYKASNYSLKYKVHVDPFQVEGFEKTLRGEKPEQEVIPEEIIHTKPKVNNQAVLMQDPNGKKYQIPANEVEDAIQDGLILVEG